jgi:serine/threonine protein kinase
MQENERRSIQPGARVGSYEIQAFLGAGGMGEVYRARDSRLGRDVAIKILPHLFTADRDRLARFEREAHLLASLNHQNIGAIYGVEESDGVRALVLELVEGETLADRLAHGSVSLPVALGIARQIADGLDIAHQQGIVHRDLKPANIKITPRGTVKVLDFGLAKAVQAEASASDPTHSPTVTIGGTREGVLLGTVAYMSPEQARARPVDKRTDIWAFGCVLFEMLSGRAAFAQETTSDTIAAILGREPDWALLPAGTPPSIRRLLQRCLDKNQDSRLRDIGDARLELDEVLSPTDTRETSSSHLRVAAPRRSTNRRRLVVAAVVSLGVAASTLWALRRSPAWTNPLEGATFTRLTDFGGAKDNAVISRDGKFFAFLSDRSSMWDAWVGQIGAGDVHNLTNGTVKEIRNPAVRTVNFSPDGLLVTIWNRTVNGSAGASPLVDGGWAVPTMGGELRPYLPGIAELDWSPDGAQIVYHPSATGDPIFVTQPGERVGRQIFVTRPGLHNHFQVWSPDGQFIYFVHGVPLDEMDVWRIRPTGGEPERLTFHNSRVTFPTLLDARTLLYLATDSDGSGPWIYGMDVARREAHRISSGVDEYTSLAASADGRRLVATISRSTASLWKVSIADRPVGTTDASPVALPSPRSLSPRFAPAFMVYRVPRAGTDAIWKLAEGRSTELWSGADGRAIEGPAIAPDGQRIAFVAQKRGQMQLHVMNADGSGTRRIAADLDVRGAPAWSPDGRWLAIAAVRDGDPKLVKVPVDGGAPVTLTAETAFNPSWAPSGRFLVYTGPDVGTTFRLKAVAADGSPRTVPDLVLSRGARRLAFRGSDDVLVVLRGDISHKEFWEVDLRTGRLRQLTDLGRSFLVGDFDVSRDGGEIVFDRLNEESDIVLIDRPAR